MHLHDLMGWSGPMTHRQFLAWQAWQRMDIEQPQRAEIIYQMQSAQAAGGYQKRLQDHCIEFEAVEEEAPVRPTAAQRTATMKSIVRAAVQGASQGGRARTRKNGRQTPR